MRPGARHVAGLLPASAFEECEPGKVDSDGVVAPRIMVGAGNKNPVGLVGSHQKPPQRRTIGRDPFAQLGISLGPRDGSCTGNHGSRQFRERAERFLRGGST